MDILDCKLPGDLFSEDLHEYKDLCKKHHPDHGGNDKVFAHIQELYRRAQELKKTGKWEASNYIQFDLIGNKKLKLNFLYRNDFELGTRFICQKSVVYIFNKDKYIDNAILRINGLKYKDADMEKIIGSCVPNKPIKYKLETGLDCLIIPKTQEVIPLDLLHKYFNNQVPDRHVAWIMSRLSNLCCYLQNQHLTHNGINLENCFVSPEFHTVLLLGGWWYTVNHNEHLIGTTKEIFDIMPIKEKTSKVSSYITDLESVKLIGRKLLGNRKDLGPFYEFVNGGSSDNAIKEFKKWDKACDDTYGKRKFVKMEVDYIKFY
jgi:hypothetical protein